jgi:hypothetical protein
LLAIFLLPNICQKPIIKNLNVTHFTIIFFKHHLL